MSILIKGMEMPDRCFACPMCDTDCCGVSKGSYIEYRDVDVDVAMDGRPDWCPLVPVPEHGRLIEWVSAKERLPEAGKPVLCACRANIYEVMKMRTDGSWVHNDAVYDSAYMGGFVTHWAELPTIIPASEEGER